MKYVDEYRDSDLARSISAEIARLSEGRSIKLMEVCGGHTHTIYKHGIEDVLPRNIDLVHGPGCPVCVLPMGRIDDAIAIAHTENVIFTTFGDMMRVPGSHGSLLDAKAARIPIARLSFSPSASRRRPHPPLLPCCARRRRRSKTSPSSAITSPSYLRSRLFWTRPTCAWTALLGRGT